MNIFNVPLVCDATANMCCRVCFSVGTGLGLDSAMASHASSATA